MRSKRAVVLCLVLTFSGCLNRNQTESPATPPADRQAAKAPLPTESAIPAPSVQPDPSEARVVRAAPNRTLPFRQAGPLPPAPPAPAESKPLDVGELIASYAGNKLAAEEEYTRKGVTIIGTVDRVEGGGVFLCQADSKPRAFGRLLPTVFCGGLPRSDLLRLRPGQTVTLKGKCSGICGGLYDAKLGVAAYDCQMISLR